MAEPRRSRWRRRALTIPAMLAGTTAAIAALPLLLPAVALADLIRLRLRFPTVRIYLFLLQYLINDSAEILVAPVYWALAGFGTSLDSPASLARHERIQAWSVSVLARRAEHLLGLRIEFDDEGRSALTPGPVIVVSRHASLFDASLPGLLYHAESMTVRGVIMAELLADPGFDLIYGRLGSVFIPRDRGTEATTEIRAMTASADDRTAFVIFPEGRLFDPAVRDRSLDRLAETDPDRARRLAGLRCVLPPRPGGILALLSALPRADVVVIRHRGLDHLRTVADLAAAVPSARGVTVRAERVARADIPADPDQQIRWLDELWLELDRELAPARPAAPRAGPT